MNKQLLIDNIKSHLPTLGINIDCSRFENSYSGYQDSRCWFMKFNDGEISIDTYLNGLSEDKLHTMNNLIDI